MTTETQVSPAEETQNQSAEAVTNENLEVVSQEDETQVESHEPETGDERDKTIRRMQRRIDKKHGDAAAAAERARIAEERLAQIEASRSQPETKPETDPLVLAAQISRINEVTTKSNAIALDGRKRFSDFKEAIQTVAEEAGPLFDRQGLPTALGEAVLDAEDGAALLRFIGSDPDRAAELRGLTSTQIGRRVERFEAQMKAKPKTSSAPKPLTPVKPSASAEPDPAKMTDAQWFEARRKAKLGR